VECVTPLKKRKTTRPVANCSLRKGSFMEWELILVPQLVAIFVMLLLFHIDNIGRQQW
jgi:hypothetical protein